MGQSFGGATSGSAVSSEHATEAACPRVEELRGASNQAGGGVRQVKGRSGIVRHPKEAYHDKQGVCARAPADVA